MDSDTANTNTPPGGPVSDNPAGTAQIADEIANTDSAEEGQNIVDPAAEAILPAADAAAEFPPPGGGE